MEQIMNKLEAELWNSFLCEPPRCLLGLLARGGYGGGERLNSRRSVGGPLPHTLVATLNAAKRPGQNLRENPQNECAKAVIHRFAVI